MTTPRSAPDDAPKKDLIPGEAPEAVLRASLSSLLAYEERRTPMDPAGYQRAARELNAVLVGPFKGVLNHSFDRAPQAFREACAHAHFELHGRLPPEAGVNASWLQAAARLAIYRAATRRS